MAHAVVHAGGRGEVHADDRKVNREDHADHEEEEEKVDSRIDHSHWEGRQGVLYGPKTTATFLIALFCESKQ
jgi:hypothetical protein